MSEYEAESPAEERCRVIVERTDAEIARLTRERGKERAEATRLRNEAARVYEAETAKLLAEVATLRADLDRSRAAQVVSDLACGELLRERDEAVSKLRKCATCDGTGQMDVIVDVLPPDEREVLAPELCGECHGTCVSSWGQALAGAEAAERERDEALKRVAALEADAKIGRVVREFDAEARAILGRPCFTCGPIADVLRRMGRTIPPKAEDEQAEVLRWMLGLYAEHGAQWREKGDEELRSADEAKRTG